MKTEGPLTDGKQTMLECDCSICTRVRLSSHPISISLATPTQDGTTLTYPSSTAFSVATLLHLSAYSYGRNFNEHKFCSICGVPCTYTRNDQYSGGRVEKWKGDALRSSGDQLSRQFEVLRGRRVGGFEGEGTIRRFHSAEYPLVRFPDEQTELVMCRGKSQASYFDMSVLDFLESDLEL